MYPTTCEYMVYLGRRELTEEEIRRGEAGVEGFKRCFLPPGAEMTRISGKKD